MLHFQNHLVLDHLSCRHPRQAIHTGPPYGFAFGRTALFYGLQAFGLDASDEILMPDYICDVILEPLSRLGIQPAYFPLDQELRPRWDLLPDRVTVRTRALCMPHYFGQPQPIGKFLDFCNAHNLLLIEDNSHGHGGRYQGRLLGTWGDIGFSSPRKTFPVPHGGLLYLNTATPFEPPVLEPSPVSPIQCRCKSLLQRTLYWLPRLRGCLVKRVDYASREDPGELPLRQDYAMLRLVREALENADMNTIRQTRQELYHLWLDWATGHRLTPVFSRLDDEAMPMKFPAYTSSREESKAWFEWGYRHGINVVSWPRLPKACLDPQGSAYRRWEKLICFPIHQQMQAPALAKILQNLPGVPD
jgi:hypothetical protein